MCGICGIVPFACREAIDDDAVLKMCNAMRYRGPDDIGFLRLPDVHLGHVRLSIIDLSGGHQPMSNENGTVTTVFNGEIYNYPKLRPKLEARGHVFRTNADTEVLVHLYEDYGRDLVNHLLGEFVFAIWDESKKYFLLVRDRLGVKPVYYADINGTFIFASEITPLMTNRSIPRRLDHSAINTYFYTKCIPAPRTIYKDIKKLLPGHYLEIKNGHVAISQYWDINYESDESLSEDDYAGQLRELLDDSVKGQLMSDVPLGAFLSGGVDSSSVVASMVRGSGDVKTFSIGFREETYNESRFYKKVSRELDVDHREFIFEPNLVDVIPKLVYHFGEPCAIGSAIPLYYLAKLAREYITVTLTGDGADEIFAGYNDYYYANLIRIIKKTVGWLVGREQFGHLLNGVRAKTTSKFGKFLYRLKKIHRLVNQDPSLWIVMMVDLHGLGQSLLVNTLEEEVPEYVSFFKHAQKVTDDWLWPYLYTDIKNLLPDHMFTKLDRMTMANSLEGRVPFADYRLVELSARIPSRMKLKRSNVKAIVKKAMQERIPREVIKRFKVGFRVPFNEWFRGPLRTMAYDLLCDKSFRESGIFNVGAVEALINRHMEELGNHGNEIFSLLVFEIWRRNLHKAQELICPQSV
jgi:asparagine synthase (glutamine-hydrolysing)